MIDREQTLYEPRYEHAACGMGFITQVTGERSHQIIEKR